MYGEVVVTRPNKKVLDIGLKVAPGKIRCRYSGHPTDGKWYGGSIETLSHFKPTGDQMDEDYWDEITRGESTEKVCKILNIPYIFEEDKEENMDEKIWHKTFKKYLDDYYAIHKLNKDGIIEFEHMQTLLSKLLDDIMTTFDSEINQ